MIPIAPLLGGIVAGTASIASNVAGSAVYDHFTGGQTDGQKEDGTGEKGILARLLGIPPFNPEAAKTAVIQGAVVTALIVLFFVGLAMFVSRSRLLK